jgi:hypothetical protein
MMKFLGSLVAALALMAAPALACPPVETEGGSAEVVLAKSSDEKGGCAGKKATEVAAKEGKEGCGKKAEATLASDKDAKGGCAGKAATEVAAKEGKEGCGKSATLASDKDAKGGCATKSGCCKSKNAALAGMPAMKYRVGDNTLDTIEAAEAAAKEHGKSVQYVVGEETFGEMPQAVEKLTVALETYATTITTVQYAAGGECVRCPMTAKALAEKNGGKVSYRVAGIDFESKDKAEKAVKLASEAAKTVSMQILVEGAPAHCAKDAQLAADKGQKVTYKVGDEESCCKIMAGKMLAEAKIRAIVEAAAKANA